MPNKGSFGRRRMIQPERRNDLLVRAQARRVVSVELAIVAVDPLRVVFEVGNAAITRSRQPDVALLRVCARALHGFVWFHRACVCSAPALILAASTRDLSSLPRSLFSLERSLPVRKFLWHLELLEKLRLLGIRVARGSAEPAVGSKHRFLLSGRRAVAPLPFHACKPQCLRRARKKLILRVRMHVRPFTPCPCRTHRWAGEGVGRFRVEVCLVVHGSNHLHTLRNPRLCTGRGRLPLAPLCRALLPIHWRLQKK